MAEQDIFEKEVEQEEKEDKKCIAKTSAGNSCNNTAIWPEDNPQACHLESHQNQIKAIEEAEQELEESEEDEIEEVIAEKIDTGHQGHIFSSQRKDHKLIIQTNKRRIVVRFNKGVYKTTDDIEAKLIQDYVNKHSNLKSVIEKVQ